MAVKAKVLLVDDSKFLRMANERALSKAGFEVSTAADGEEALQVVNDKPPDIILLDMMLPKISGPEVLRALKANPATMNIPVIVLTSLSQRNEKRLLQEGAAAYFEKSTLELDKSSDLLGGHGRDGPRPGQSPKKPESSFAGLSRQKKRPLTTERPVTWSATRYPISPQHLSDYWMGGVNRSIAAF